MVNGDVNHSKMSPHYDDDDGNEDNDNDDVATYCHIMMMLPHYDDDVAT